MLDAVRVASVGRDRGHEVAFLVERYHRAFEDEIRVITASLPARAGPIANPPLIARIEHLVAEIQDHLAAEARVLAPWTMFD